MKYVLVESVTTYMMRYVITLDDKSDPEWAADNVVMGEAQEFSQRYIGEDVLSCRVISREEVLALCDQDNSYAQDWSEEKKFEVFVTEIGENR